MNGSSRLEPRGPILSPLRFFGCLPGGEHPLQARLDPLPPCLEEHVESRDQENAERRDHAHSEEHRRA